MSLLEKVFSHLNYSQLITTYPTNLRFTHLKHFNLIQKSIHIVVIFSVLLSTTGLVIHKHYCQDELKSVSFLVEADHCHETAPMPPSCPFHSSHDTKNSVPSDCCDNEVEYLKSDQDLQIESNQNSISQTFVHQIVYYVVNEWILSELICSFPHYLNFKPPLIVCNVILFLQTFLC